MVTLITGGIKSGKTSYGLSLGKLYTSKAYIATAVSFDNEMKDKIEMHQKERGKLWKTVEEPIEISKALFSITEDFVMIDCVTLWLNNLMYYEKDIDLYIKSFCDTLIYCPKEVIIVTNEIGLGVIPEKKNIREYINKLGLLNQKIGEIADRVVLMVSGIPIYIKGEK
jgi:adenosylcobinamide kinase/adenosylcobinamide-phosphate guanylyltransferase